jgi:hypothetical protein
MRRVDISIPQFGLAVATRAALGAGIALLAAGRLSRSTRRKVGAALVTLGALTTVPIFLAVFGAKRDAGPVVHAA